jgi:D-proline reductase (dithiol) PrdB
MMNLALISSAGGYIDGSEPFDTAARDGDLSYREIPIEVDAADMRYAAKGYDPKHVYEDRNCQIPIDRLLEYQANAVIGNLNNVWWSISSHIPNAARLAAELGPALAARLHRYDIQAALLIPASRLCHQTVGVLARVIENAGIPTLTLSVDTTVTDRVRPPRTAYYTGEPGSVAGKPNWREYQLRILDEALRWMETFDQPGSRKLAVDLESQTEAARGER